MFKKMRCSIWGHVWSYWAYREDNSCVQTRTCERDGAEEERVLHSFEDWTYDKQGACDQSRICTRCEAREDRLHHQYSQNAKCGSYRSCDRCGHKDLVQHVFLPTSRNADVDVKLDDSFQVPVRITIYRCSNCGKEEKRVGMQV